MFNSLGTCSINQNNTKWKQRLCYIIESVPSSYQSQVMCAKKWRELMLLNTHNMKGLFCSVFDVFLCSKGNFVSSWKDDNARRAYFLMLYAKCNTWCTSISSFRKFNFKYASEVSTTFLRTYRVVSRPLKILFNHSVIDQKDKETFFFCRHMLSTLCHMTMIEGAREEKTIRFSIWEE